MSERRHFCSGIKNNVIKITKNKGEMMKSNKKRNLAFILTGLLSIVLFSCARERGRTDISLEMTDEDSVEAIIDQDLLTAGGTVVNLEEPEQTTAASKVVYVDETGSQKPAVVEADKSLKPTEGAVSETDSFEEPAIGLIDVEDTQIASEVKEQDKESSTKKPVERALTTEELIAENKALINSELMTEEAEETVEETPEEAPAEETVEETAEETPAEETPADENVLPGEDVATAISNTTAEETTTDEITFPDEIESTVTEVARTEKPAKIEKPGVRPAVVRPPGGSYYTEYTTLDKTKSSPRQAVKRDEPSLDKTSSYQQHTVKRGDTLWVISRKYGCTISELVAENNISRRSILKIGQILKIPVKQNDKGTTPSVADTAVISTIETVNESPYGTANMISETVEVEVEAPKTGTDTYTVQSGDSYWKIARKYGVTSSELMSLNNTDNSIIRVGQKILVPRK